MKKSIKVLLIFTLGTIFGVSLLITYASTYNSEEISYDNSNSHAEAENVKDAIDYLYSHGFSTCPEDMTCIESPVVTINSSGPGSVDKESMHIRINGSNTFTVTPNEGYTLNSIACDNGYILSSFNVLSNEAMSAQTITVTNPGIITGASCSIEFSTNEISISSAYKDSYGADKCNSSGVGCVCWYIYNYDTGVESVETRGQNFSYSSHTGCRFKSKTCTYTSGTESGKTTDCTRLYWNTYWPNWDTSSGASTACSGVITCAT